MRSFLFLLSLISVVNAETLWPEFRGPSAQGHSTAVGVPTVWDAKKNVIWRQEVAGRAWSQPVVANGKIFLTTAVKEATATELLVLALDAATGQQLWQTKVFSITNEEALKMHAKNSQASPTPVYEEGKIYAHFSHHGTACLEETGAVLWTSTENVYSPLHGTGGSPVIVDDLLIYHADGISQPSVIALHKKSGKTAWKVQRESAAKRKFSFCTPLLIQVNGERQLISPGSGVVQALNPKDGKEIWHVNYDQGFSVVPRPIFAQGLVWICTGYDKAKGLAIRPDGQGDVTATHVAWMADKRVPLNPSCLVVEEDLYMLDDNGLLSCRDMKTGTLYYEERLLGPSSASLLYADGHIYAIDELGKTAVVTPGHTLKVLARNELLEKTLASMALCENDLLIRTEKALYRIGKR